MNRLIINKADLFDNAKKICDFVENDVIGIVKMNGYGIGLKNAVLAWYDAGVRTFGVSTVEEAREFLSLDFEDAKVMLLAPVYDENIIKELSDNGVILTVENSSHAKLVADVSSGASVQVKIDVGMGRFGENSDNLDKILEIYETENLQFYGIFAHFSASFEKEYKLTKIQLERFKKVLSFLEEKGIKVGLRHIANSAAALRFKDTHFDAVRVGSALVGRLSCTTPLKLNKIGVLEAEVVSLKKLNKGQTSGYASIFKAKKDVSCAVVSLGVFDGFGTQKSPDNFRFIDTLRNIFNSIRNHKKCRFAIAGGQKFPIVGRLGNQYTLVDTKGAEISVGDYLEFDANILMINPEIERILQ